MIPTTIEQLAATRPTSHGQVTDQEIRVGQMLLAQSILGLTRCLDAFLAAVEREPEAEEPKPTKAPRGSRANPIDAMAEGHATILPPRTLRAPKAPPAPAPVEPPAPVGLRSNGVPVDLALRYHEAYLEGAGARRGGQAVDLNPFTGDRGIAGGRRLAWVRGWNEGAA